MSGLTIDIEQPIEGGFSLGKTIFPTHSIPQLRIIDYGWGPTSFPSSVCLPVSSQTDPIVNVLCGAESQLLHLQHHSCS